jgi:hypothetical protein
MKLPRRRFLHLAAGGAKAIVPSGEEGPLSGGRTTLLVLSFTGFGPKGDIPRHSPDL